jgi:hypothetical protein
MSTSLIYLSLSQRLSARVLLLLSSLLLYVFNALYSGRGGMGAILCPLDNSIAFIISTFSWSFCMNVNVCDKGVRMGRMGFWRSSMRWEYLEAFRGVLVRC